MGMADKHDVLYIIMPAYNEAENIEQVIQEWYPVVERYSGNGKSRLVIIDDGSKDETSDKIRMKVCGGGMPLLIGIQKENSGHGATLLYGYQYAIKQEADYIFQTDSDGQTVADEFHEFWKIRSEWDMVAGYRNHRQDGFSRILVTKILKLALLVCFGVKITDANVPYRLMKAETLKKHLSLVPKDFNLSNVLISVIYAKKRLKVKFFPITFRPRQGGVNSINILKIIRIGRKAVIDFWNFKKELK